MAHYPDKYSARRKLVLPTYRHLIKAQTRIARRCPGLNHMTDNGAPNRYLLRSRLTYRIEEARQARFDAWWARYFAQNPDQWDDGDSDSDYSDHGDYCETCGNTGYLNCYCGGNPEPECPDCG